MLLLTTAKAEPFLDNYERNASDNLTTELGLTTWLPWTRTETEQPASRSISDPNAAPAMRIMVLAQAILLPLAVVLGVFGNVMIIVIIFRLRRRSSATDLVFLALAVCDLCTNLTGPLVIWSSRILGFDLRVVHDALCKMINFVLNVTSSSSSWLLVTLSVQRSLAVTWPHRVNAWCTSRKLWAVIVGVICFFCLFYSHIFYGFYVLMSSSGPTCGVTSVSYFAFMNDFLKFDLVLWCYLPFTLLAISNSVLVVHLRESVVAPSGSVSQEATRKQKYNSVTLTAFITSTIFVVLLMPLAVYNATSFIVVGQPPNTVEDYVRRIVYQRSVHIVGYFCYSINFYLYCMTGSRFKDEFFRILGLRK